LPTPGVAWLDLLQFVDLSPAIRAPEDVFIDALTITLEAHEDDAALHYTLDGGDPTTDSPRYTGPITLTETATVKAASYKDGMLVGSVTEATFRRVEPREPVPVEDLRPGLECAYYEGTWTQLPDFDALEPVARGVTEGFDISPRRRDDHFGLRFTGYLEAPRDGIYTLAVRSDDGSRLFIGEDQVVDNDGLHGRVERSDGLALKAGLHPIAVTFFERDGAELLEVYYQGPDLPRRPIPASALWRPGP
jgi:hypothetical protein